MTCRCGSSRTAGVSAKCSDMCVVTVGMNQKEGYVPRDMGIGGGDYIKFSWCLNCGQIQGLGKFPVGRTELEGDAEDEE